MLMYSASSLPDVHYYICDLEHARSLLRLHHSRYRAYNQESDVIDTEDCLLYDTETADVIDIVDYSHCSSDLSNI